MCGIAGFVGKGDKTLLTRMTNTLIHRGPDGEGYFFDPINKVGLGHRRLAIIDLASGNQPMFNEKKTVAVVFNGEIYNFKTLHATLKTNHVFATNSDTEVIVHLYEEMGEKCFEKLEGMFAIALWDARKNKLILARDRFGEKPLYWTHTQGTIVFASEPKALFAHDIVKKELNRDALFKYLFYEYVPSPHTIFHAIQKLEPAHYLIYEKGEIQIECYYHLSPHSWDNAEVQSLEARIEKAVANRMIADVPLGVFLSGGIDSSTIAYFAQKHSPSPINTFSIGFEEQSFDESAWARRAAQRIGTRHHERIFTKKELLSVLPVIGEKLDEPFADASLLPTYLLSSFAREKVTVALGGDGGDELFFGYPTFLAHKLWSFYDHFPRVVKYALQNTISFLPVSHTYFSFDFKAKQFFGGGTDDDLLRNQQWLGAFHPNEYPLLLSNSFRTTYAPSVLMEDIDRHRAYAHEWERFAQIDYLYIKHYMAEDILTKVDRASMYCALEVRSPFLDTSLVEYAFALPRNLKLKGLTTKYILKQTMAPLLGKDIVFRKKKGFGIPLAQWLTHDLGDMLTTYLRGSHIAREGIFNPSYIETLIREHLEKKADHRKRLWTLLMFEMWKERWNI